MKILSIALVSIYFLVEEDDGLVRILCLLCFPEMFFPLQHLDIEFCCLCFLTFSNATLRWFYSPQSLSSYMQTFSFPSFYLTFYFKMKIKMKQIKWFTYAFSYTYVDVQCFFFFVLSLKYYVYMTGKQSFHQYRMVCMTSIFAGIGCRIANICSYMHTDIYTYIRVSIDSVRYDTCDNLIFQVNAAQSEYVLVRSGNAVI